MDEYVSLRRVEDEVEQGVEADFSAALKQCAKSFTDEGRSDNRPDLSAKVRWIIMLLRPGEF